MLVARFCGARGATGLVSGHGFSHAARGFQENWASAPVGTFAGAKALVCHYALFGTIKVVP